MNKTVRNIADYFYLLRPTLFFPGITIFLFGTNDYGSFSLYNLIITLFLLGVIYLTNQIFDIETDKINNKLFFLTQGIISKKAAIAYDIILFIAYLIMLWFSSNNFIIIQLLTLTILGLFYNIPPIEFKNRPIGSVFSSFYGGCAFYIIGTGDLNTDIIFNSLPFGLALISAGIMTMIPDRDGDERVGKITFVVKYGKKRSLYLIAITHLLNIILYFVFPEVGNLPIAITAGVSLILLIPVFLGKKGNGKIELSIKASVFLLSLFAGVLYPLYIILMAVYFVFTRYYYSERFKIKYP